MKTQQHNHTPRNGIQGSFPPARETRVKDCFLQQIHRPNVFWGWIFSTKYRDSVDFLLILSVSQLFLRGFALNQVVPSRRNWKHNEGVTGYRRELASIICFVLFLFLFFLSVPRVGKIIWMTDGGGLDGPVDHSLSSNKSAVISLSHSLSLYRFLSLSLSGPEHSYWPW